jgi:primosomal protein N' (replication factor Y)
MVNVIKEGEADILIGTQMLAKGHDFPNLNMVGILDADRGLFSTDFRAGEHMAQLIIQVSGRAGRTNDKGRVFIQTHYPDHPLLRTLVDTGYQAFARKVLEERVQAGLPPYSYQVLLRSDDYRKETSDAFLNEARSILGNTAGIEVYGPYPAPLEQKAGRLRYQLLLQSRNRNLLLNALTPWIRDLESLPSSKKVRWSVDVDPLEY